MATQTVTKHYANICAKPDCIVEGAAVIFFFRNDALSPGNLPYIEGLVTLVVETATGAIDATFSYDDADLPDGVDMILDDPDTVGTVCDPDCFGEGSWLWKVQKLTDRDVNPSIINRSQTIYAPDEHVVNNTFNLARIPYTGGLRLSAIRLTCDRYDTNTTIAATIKVGATSIATFTGTLASIRGMTLLVTDLTLDQKPVLELTSVSSVIYADGALGLVVEMIGALL